MDYNIPFYLVILLAFIWGVFWASCLQFTQWGAYLAVKRTWITVVIGVGINLLLSFLAIDANVVAKIIIIFSASALAIIGRSLWNEFHEDVPLKNGLKKEEVNGQKADARHGIQ